MKGKKKNTNEKSLLIIGGVLLVIIVGVVIANLILKGNGSKSLFAKVNACGTGCATCMNGTCKKCNFGYSLVGTKCQKNSAGNPCDYKGCKTCDKKKKICTSCQSGYKLNNKGLCVISCNVDNCLLCNSSDVCVKCQKGYTLTNNKCIKKDGPNILKSIALYTYTSNYRVGDKMIFNVDATNEIGSMIITFYNPVSFDGHYYGHFNISLVGKCTSNNSTKCTFEGYIPEKNEKYYGTTENNNNEMYIYPGTYEVSSIFVYDNNGNLIRYTTDKEFADSSEFLYYPAKIKINIEE
jgi:hypothetical protein